MAITAQRDVERSVVYAVEDQWGQVLDRGGDLDFFGSSLQLPRQQVFPNLVGIQRYVDGLLAKCAMDGAAPGPVQVRHRRGATRAHYESSPSPSIAIPIGAGWACREVVVLHELAHHLRATEAAGCMHHDAGFRRHLVVLAGYALGTEAAFILRAGYQGAGLKVAPL